MLDSSTRALIVAEPARVYIARPPLVVDCSVLSALLFHEPNRDQALFALAGKDLFAPDLMDYEIANVAVKKSAFVATEFVTHALLAFSQLQLTRYRVTATRQFELASQFGLTAYDAAYLAVAAEINAPLVTFDAKLGQAARQLLG